MQIGDLVVNPPNPHWGIGIVIELETDPFGMNARVRWNDGYPMWMMFKHLEVLCKSEI